MGSISKRNLLAQFLVSSGSEWLLQRMGVGRGLTVLNYHRIGDPTRTSWDHGLWSATQDEFDWQIGFLKKNFDLIGVSDLKQARSNSRGRHVLITFDDGYRDNYQGAFPVLKSHGVLATFFLATGFLDQPHVSWWDEIAWMIRTTTAEYLDGPDWLADPILIDHLQPQTTIKTLLKLIKSLPTERTADFLEWLGRETGRGRCPVRLAADEWMTWDMVREMHAGGMQFGAHTVTHPVLSRMPAARQQWEITESRRRIEQELGAPIQSFSYPVGGPTSYTPETLTCLADAGFQWAFRYGRPFASDLFGKPFEIPRFAVERSTERTLFRATSILPHIFN